MELITKQELRNIRTIFESVQGVKTFSEFINESRTRKSTSNETTIFLSHKHDEVEQLKDAIALLKKFGVSVYIDHFDEEMPKHTSGITAQKLKKRIDENKKFILLATERAIASKWCNWELGYGDARKYIDHIALLVVKDNEAQWSGSEYLQIYPVICKKYYWSDNDYIVEFPDGHKQDLTDWLK